MARKSIYDRLGDTLSDNTSYLLDDDFDGDDKENAIKEVIQSAALVDISKLEAFKDYPYRIEEDIDDFIQLVDSIKENGIFYPILVRPKDNDTYEIISGHRRVAAAKAAGLTEVSFIVRMLNDDEATITMVHSNFYRDKIRISEKAKAYRMCLETEKHQGVKGEDTAEKAGKNEDSKRQVYRYIRLSYLEDSYLDMVDDGLLPFNVGYELSFLDEESRENLSAYISNEEKVPSLEQSMSLKNLYNQKEDSLTYKEIFEILNASKGEKKTAIKVTLDQKKLYEYFEPDMSVDTMQSIILELLEGYKSGKITLKYGEYEDA